ncbi:MAG: DMT family transporter [Alphaproteobacteria bacterium]
MTAATERARTAPPWAPLALLLGLGTIWGVMLVMGRQATADGVPPMAFAFWNCVGGATIIAGVARLRRVPLTVDARHLRYYAIAGLISTAFPNTLAFTVVAPIGTGLTGVLYALSPLFTYAFAMAVRIDRFDPLRSAGLAMGLAGTLLILLPQSSLPSPEALHWVLLGLVMPVALASGNVYRNIAWPPGAHPITLAVGMLVAAALWLTPAMLVTDAFYWPLPPADLGDWSTVAIFFVGGLIYILYFELQRLAGPVYFSQISYVITASGVVFGMAVFSERHAIWVWLAIAVICGGILLVNRRR